MKKKTRTQKKKAEPVSTFPKRVVKTILLFLPAAVSFVWLTYLKLSSKTIMISQDGIMFAPPRDSKGLAFGLFMFTIGYLLFLGLMFFTNIKEALHELKLKLKH